MARVIETTVYSFNELSDSAKDVARDWYRRDSEFDAHDVIYDANEIAAILGIEISQRRESRALAIYWTGFSSQGDGACFEGRYQYRKGAAKAIREHAPKDTELHRIADELQTLQSRYFYKLEAATTHRGFYYHSGCMVVSVADNRTQRGESDSFAEDTLSQLMRDFADWIYRQLERDYDWHMSDDVVDESIVANAYEFSESGSIV